MLLGDDGNLYAAISSPADGWVNFWNGASWVSGGDTLQAYCLGQVDGLVIGRGEVDVITRNRYWDGERSLADILPLAGTDILATRQRMEVLQYGEETYVLYIRSVAGTEENDDINMY